MPEQKIETTEYQCSRCLYRWITRKNGKESETRPNFCARCKTWMWDKPREHNMVGFYKHQAKWGFVSERTKKDTTIKATSAIAALEPIQTEREERRRQEEEQGRQILYSGMKKTSEVVAANKVSKPKLHPHKPGKGKRDLDVWKAAYKDTDGVNYERMCNHYYKRYGKDGYLIEQLLIENEDTKVVTEVCQVYSGASSIMGAFSSKDALTKELEARRKYWLTHTVPINEIHKARKSAEEYQKAYSKLTDKQKTDYGGLIIRSLTG